MMTARSVMACIGATEAPNSPTPIPLVTPGLPAAAVAVCRRQFASWPITRPTPPAAPYQDYQSWNKGYWIEVDGEPGFAETAVQRMLEREGWNARWVTWLRGRPTFRLAPRVGAVAAPEGTGAAWFEAIWREKERRRSMLAESGVDVSELGGGCWDVIGWKDSEIVFVETKQVAETWQDAIRPSQRLWLEAALSIGVGADAFLVLEWTRR